MSTSIAGLHASAPQPLPFAPSLDIRAMMLIRSRGNLLIYSTADLASAAQAIDDLGGLDRHYLSHRHEAMFVSNAVTAPLFCHALERDAVERVRHVRGSFSRRHMLDEDFEVIPAPGHTAGATAYMWDSGEHRILFTGDTIYLREGEWVAALLDGTSDRDAHIESLELIRELAFDVLVPWAASRGPDHYTLTSRLDAQRRIDLILERLRRGADH